jgi:Uma2 family endonuclease
MNKALILTKNMFTHIQIEQSDPPRSPRETLPTMYDLPSEDPEELGLPDEFHYLQPQLLSATLRLTNYSPDQVFSVGDMNLYYDVRHPLWHKRPDWFLVLGVPRLYNEEDLRLSYVIWQEGMSPFVVVELLSPGTEKEDLGEVKPKADQPPPKWQVYEQILRVPYYIVFDRYTDQFRGFGLTQGSYQPLEMSAPKIWMPELNLGLGVWLGEYQHVTRQWLRWYDARGNWIPTETEVVAQERQHVEQVEILLSQERQRAEQAEALLSSERQRAEQEKAQLIERLRAMGIDPDQLLDNP